LLGDGDVATGECDVVMGGKEGDQAEGHSADGLGDTEPVKPEGAGAWLVEREIISFCSTDHT
jgi:hypothetical protein